MKQHLELAVDTIAQLRNATQELRSDTQKLRNTTQEIKIAQQTSVQALIKMTDYRAVNNISYVNPVFYTSS